MTLSSVNGEIGPMFSMLEDIVEIHWLDLELSTNTPQGYKEKDAHTTFKKSPSGHCHHMGHGQPLGTTRLAQLCQSLRGPWNPESLCSHSPVSSSAPQTAPQTPVCRGEALEGTLGCHKTSLSGIQYRKHIKTCLHGTAVYNYCSLWDIPPLLPPILL